MTCSKVHWTDCGSAVESRHWHWIRGVPCTQDFGALLRTADKTLFIRGVRVDVMPVTGRPGARNRMPRVCGWLRHGAYYAPRVARSSGCSAADRCGAGLAAGAAANRQACGQHPVHECRAWRSCRHRSCDQPRRSNSVSLRGHREPLSIRKGVPAPGETRGSWSAGPVRQDARDDGRLVMRSMSRRRPTEAARPSCRQDSASPTIHFRSGSSFARGK